MERRPGRCRAELLVHQRAESLPAVNPVGFEPFDQQPDQLRQNYKPVEYTSAAGDGSPYSLLISRNSTLRPASSLAGLFLWMTLLRELMSRFTAISISRIFQFPVTH